MLKREIDHIVIHCTGANKSQSVESILRYWRENIGWKQVGYHRLIEPDGTIHKLADLEEITNGVKRHNSTSIHICYIGGEFEDDRTEAQKASILNCIYEAMEAIGYKVKIQGHRDFPNVSKSCPQFDAIPEYSWINSGEHLF
jgi:N-acetylmuramoyl-L-alanine amidase